MDPRVKRAIGLFPLSLSFLLLPHLAQAQEVTWRRNYNEARREAEAKNLPLVLEFNTESCFWCRKLEATTFQEATVVRIMNERFVPSRVDAFQEARLTQAVHGSSFPTVVPAAPDGKILATLEGFMEAPRFQDHLERVLAALRNPE